MNRRDFLVVGLLGMPIVSQAAEYDWPVLYSWPEIKAPIQIAKDNRPVMKFYTSDTCPVCLRAKEKLTKEVKTKLPFQIQEIDRDKSDFKGDIPAFVWDGFTGKWVSTGFWSVESLVLAWKETQKPKVSVKNNYPPMLGYRPRWYIRDGKDIWAHLRDAHGVTEPLTQDQAEAVHDLLHDGWTVQQIKSRLK